MDTRRTAGRTSAPSAGNRVPRPSPAHAAQRRPGAAAPVMPADDQEWTIGVSDLAPWELPTMTERPSALPAPQPAPWQAARREQAPWDAPVAMPLPEPAPTASPAPWDQPVRPQPAPWEQPAGSVPAPVEMLPVGAPDEVPWDRPAPFSLDDPLSDPYDAFAPLADDFALAAPTPAAASAAVATASAAVAVADAPRVSVFGSDFAADSRPQPALASALAVEDAPAPAAPGDTAMPDQTDSEALGATDEPATDAAPPANPLEWPPVPTDFPPKNKKQVTRSRKQAPADPLEWPPIPADFFGGGAATQPTGLWEATAAPATPADAGHAPMPTTTPAAPIASQPQTPAAEPAPAPHAPAAVDPNAAPWALPEASPAAATAGMVEQVASDIEPPADPAAAEDDWLLRNVVDERPAPVPVPPARPPAQAGALAEEQPGAVFARYAAGVSAPSRPQMLPSRRVEDPFAPSPANDGGDDLWFLANEPQSGGNAGEMAEVEPSSMQTAVATVLVAAIVIGLVIVFLLLFTSVFR